MMRSIQRASIGLVSLLMLGTNPIYSADEAKERAVPRSGAARSSASSERAPRPNNSKESMPKTYSTPGANYNGAPDKEQGRVYSSRAEDRSHGREHAKQQEESTPRSEPAPPSPAPPAVRHPSPSRSEPDVRAPERSQDRAVPRDGRGGSQQNPAPSHPSPRQEGSNPPAYRPGPQQDRERSPASPNPMTDAERRHPRPDGHPNPSYRPGVFDHDNRHFYPWGFRYHPFYPGPWWMGSPYDYYSVWYPWSHDTIIYLTENNSKYERNAKKEDFNIYQMTTFTPVILEEIILGDKNPLCYTRKQQNKLRELVDYYKLEFLKANDRNEDDEEKRLDKHYKLQKYYTEDLEDFFKHNKPDCK